MMVWKVVKRSAKKMIAGLPEKWRFPIIRKLVRFKPTIQSDFEVGFATSPQDILTSLELVRTAYIERGFLKQSDEKKINPYFFNEGTGLVCLKRANRIVGTFMIVTAQGRGLPLERVFSIENYKLNSKNIFEISSLAIARDVRRESGFNGLFYMMKFLFYHLYNHRAGHFLFATCLPRDTDFYRAILLFDYIQGDYFAQEYLGAPASGMVLDLNTISYRMTELFRKEGIELYKFLLSPVGTELRIADDFRLFQKLLAHPETMNFLKANGWTVQK